METATASALTWSAITMTILDITQHYITNAKHRTTEAYTGHTLILLITRYSNAPLGGMVQCANQSTIRTWDK